MKRNILSFLFIAGTLGLIVAIAFSNTELTNAWDVLFTLDLKWVLMALAGWFAYLFFDMLSMRYFLRQQQYPITLGSAFYVTLTGFYYSNITPGASGGQPMQVYYLSKHGVPVPIGTSAISIKFYRAAADDCAVSGGLLDCEPGFCQRPVGQCRMGGIHRLCD